MLYIYNAGVMATCKYPVQGNIVIPPVENRGRVLFEREPWILGLDAGKQVCERRIGSLVDSNPQKV